MRILQVSTRDIGGGAEKIALELHRSYRQKGHHAWLAVGRKFSDEDGVLELPRSSPTERLGRLYEALARPIMPLERNVRGIWRVRHRLNERAEERHAIAQASGFGNPAACGLLQLPPERPEVLHAHNLHGGYFDLRALRALSRQVPTFVTLHDAWLLSGHCAHSIECQRWKTGCGDCPDLTLYPAITRDVTRSVWRRKRAIFRHSPLRISTPCRWLMDEAKASILAEAAIEWRVIPHGIDLSVFHPGDQRSVRAELGIAAEARVLLFVGVNPKNNMWKDIQTLRGALSRLAEMAREKPLILVALGGDASTERFGQAELRFVHYQKDPSAVARYYQAADVYLHAARAETVGLVIMEALACATPVVATSVGGIPELIEDGMTGFVVPAGDAGAMAERCRKLLLDDEFRRTMACNAAEAARRRFGLARMVDEYLSWYEEVIT